MTGREYLEQNLLRRQAVGDYLHRTAVQVPDKTVFVFQDKRFTYREFNASVNRAAHALSALGLEKGDVMAVMSQNCHQMAIFMWACFKTGIWYSPLNYLLRNEEIIYQINHSEAKMFMVESALVEEVSRAMEKLPTVKQYGLINLKGMDLPEGWIDVDGLWTADYPETQPEVIIRDDDIASLIYTSGTTAAPKGVLLPHRSYFSMAMNAFNPASSNWEETDIYLMNIPLYHVGASSIMVGQVCAGAEAVATYGTDPAEILELIQKERITAIVWPPTLYAGLLQFPLEKYDLTSLRKLWWFGGSMPLEVLRKWMDLCPQARFAGHCSQTECNIRFTVAWLDDLPEAGNIIGKPSSDVEIRLVDASGNDVPDGKPGEAIMRSPSIMLGYYKDDEGTARTLRHGWLHTGDVLTKGQDGNYYYYDRLKDMIKSGGVNVACLEVEEVLNRHPDVQISAVFSAPHPYWTEGVTAVVVPRRESLDAEEVIEHAKKNLAGYKIPKKVILLKASDLPVSPTGKILKRELREMYKDIYQGEKGK